MFDPLCTFSDDHPPVLALVNKDPMNVPRIISHPFLIVGSTLLKHVTILGFSDNFASVNLSSDRTDLFPTDLINGSHALILPNVPLPTDTTLTYFDKLRNILLFAKNYAGVLFVEADVAELFQNSHANAYAWKLAFAYIKLLSNTPNLPKHVVVFGCTPCYEANFINDHGVGICIFNAYLRYLCQHFGFTLADTAEIFLSHRRYRTVVRKNENYRYDTMLNVDLNDYAHLDKNLCMSPPVFPLHCFTKQGELTEPGFERISTYCSQIAAKAREIGTKLGLPIRLDVLTE